MAAYRFRARIPASGMVAAGLVAMAMACLVVDVLAFEIRMLSIACGSLYLAQIPGRLFRRYNAIGDYSYSVYIYGWPIQQLILLRDPTTHPIVVIAVALPTAILCGIVSWSLVEKPALARREALVRMVHRLLPARAFARPRFPATCRTNRCAKPHEGLSNQ